MRTSHWRERIGNQRDWVWRGWQTHYTYVRSAAVADNVPLLLLHGFGASIGHWRHNLLELGQSHPVYALDMLGFGASEKAIAPYGTALWIEQVYDFWQTFIRRPVVLIGNSIGSLICVAIAAAYPEMVQAVVLLNLPDSSVLELPGWLRAATAALGWTMRPVATLSKWLITSPIVFTPLFQLIRHPRVVRIWATKAYATPTAVTDELIEILSSPAYDRGAARALGAMINGKTAQVDYTAKVILPQLQIPMLLFWGRQDAMVPPSLARLFVKQNSNLKLIEIDNAGHCPHDECPEVVNREILNWLAARPGTPHQTLSTL